MELYAGGTILELLTDCGLSLTEFFHNFTQSQNNCWEIALNQVNTTYLNVVTYHFQFLY
jgi:hypothetical protein